MNFHQLLSDPKACRDIHHCWKQWLWICFKFWLQASLIAPLSAGFKPESWLLCEFSVNRKDFFSFCFNCTPNLAVRRQTLGLCPKWHRQICWVVLASTLSKFLNLSNPSFTNGCNAKSLIEFKGARSLVFPGFSMNTWYCIFFQMWPESRGPWSKGRKISTSYPDGENIHHVECVKRISES